MRVGMRHISIYSREREILHIEKISISNNKQITSNPSSEHLREESGECFIENLDSLEIEMSLKVLEEEDSEIFYMKIINYDVCALEEGKGIRDIEVYKDG